MDRPPRTQKIGHSPIDGLEALEAAAAEALAQGVTSADVVLNILARSRSAPIGRWLRDLLARQHKNVVVVALANKLARICWAVLSGGHGFAEEVAEMH